MGFPRADDRQEVLQILFLVLSPYSCAILGLLGYPCVRHSLTRWTTLFDTASLLMIPTAFWTILGLPWLSTFTVLFDTEPLLILLVSVTFLESVRGRLRGASNYVKTNTFAQATILTTLTRERHF